MILSAEVELLVVNLSLQYCGETCRWVSLIIGDGLAARNFDSDRRAKFEMEQISFESKFMIQLCMVLLILLY